MIEIVKDILPKGINRLMLSELMMWNRWTMADDTSKFEQTFASVAVDKLIDGNKAYAGFNAITFDRRLNVNFDTKLNTFGDVIYFALKEKFNVGELERLSFNYYDNGAETFPHRDMMTDEYMSAVYNLHTNDGGTEIGDKFFPSVEGQAIFFESHVLHRGIPPKKSRNRFNLNLVMRR